MSLWQMSITGAVMIVVITVIRAVLINKIPKKTFLILWGMVILRLLIPFLVPSPVSIYSLAERKTEPVLDFSVNGNAAMHGGTVPEQTNNFANGLPSYETDGTAPKSPFPLWQTIWAAGTAAGGLFFVLVYIRSCKSFRTSLPVENDFVKTQIARQEFRRNVSVRRSERVSSPLTYGLIHPVILLPDSTGFEDVKTLKYVLAHECVHIRRFDVITKILLAAALCLHWINPLVWVMFLLANRDIELYCDETVVRRFGEDRKAAYAKVLIGMEEQKSGLVPFYSSFSKNAAEERITAIMKTKKITAISIVLAVVIVAFTAAVFATSRKETEDKPAGDTGASLGMELFSMMPDTFEFCSGAGGWRTQLYPSPDGSFTGRYHDSDMGAWTYDYPGGTAYICDFSGKFTEPQKVDEYTYSVRIESISYPEEGKEYIEDEIRYITSGPYGLDGADEVLIYLPGRTLEDLSDEFISWIQNAEEFWGLDDPETLPFYALNNVNMQQGFYSGGVVKHLFR